MRSETNQPSFSGLFSSDDLDQLVYFKYESSTLTIFALESRFSGHSCFQHSSELYSHSMADAVNFVGYYDCADAKKYYLSIFDSTELSVVDTVYFRGLEAGGQSSSMMSIGT